MYIAGVIVISIFVAILFAINIKLNCDIEDKQNEINDLKAERDYLIFINNSARETIKDQQNYIFKYEKKQVSVSELAAEREFLVGVNNKLRDKLVEKEDLIREFRIGAEADERI